jgi:hypothetical protein
VTYPEDEALEDAYQLAALDKLIDEDKNKSDE